MFQNPFETQNGSTTVYDGAHEYCTAEHVDEEYFRASLKKRKRSVLTRLIQGILLIGIKEEGHEKTYGQS